MKICLIVDDYMPYSIKVAAKMMHELACEFVKEGHSVSVITPDYNLKTKMDISTLDGVDIIRFKSGKIKNISKIKRAINETLLSHNAWKNCEDFFVNNPHDLIIYYSPSIFFGSLVKKLKKIWGVKSYLILRDFFPQWAVDQGMIKKGSFIEKYFRYFEDINYKNANTIGVMSEKNLEIFKEIFGNRYNVEVLYNWANNKPIQQSIDYKKDLGLENKVVYFYGGNIGHAQDMMNIVRLAQQMQKEDKAHFVLVGAGDEVELVRGVIDRDNLKNMTLLSAVSQDNFKQMLASFDVGLFSLHKDHTTHNFPGKLLGYMVQELPILGSINKGNDLQIIIEKAKAGLISINGDDQKFFENAVKFLDNDYRKEIGKNAYKLLEDKFSVESVVKQILG